MKYVLQVASIDFIYDNIEKAALAMKNLMGCENQEGAAFVTSIRPIMPERPQTIDYVDRLTVQKKRTDVSLTPVAVSDVSSMFTDQFTPPPLGSERG